MTSQAKNYSAGEELICLSNELSLSLNIRVGKPLAKGSGAKLNAIRSSNREGSVRSRSKATQRIEDSVRFMIQHLGKPVDVSTLSARAGLSNSSFFTHFKSATGQTPMSFLIRVRMRIACKLLEETTLQIKKVADLLGYNDQFYFSRAFKSVHGISPREYRRLNEKASSQRNRATTTSIPAFLVERMATPQLLSGAFIG